MTKSVVDTGMTCRPPEAPITFTEPARAQKTFSTVGNKKRKWKEVMRRSKHKHIIGMLNFLTLPKGKKGYHHGFQAEKLL